MFFPDRITRIKRGDRVLEIGPGTSAHPRSNVLLEKSFGSAEEHIRQCGGTPASATDGRTVFYDGGRFPFADNEFDYIICSHVIEHVDDVEAFCAEMFRVARSGYLEYPSIYYDYVFDIPEHQNLLMRVGDELTHLKKHAVFPPSLKPVQQFWFSALASGYTDTASDLVPFTMQGFEWFEPFKVRKARSVDELCLPVFNIPPKPPRSSRTLLGRFKRLVLHLGRLSTWS